MAHQFTTQSGRFKPNIHAIVQEALRSAAVASTPNSAIDVLGDALLQLERMIGITAPPAH